MRAYPGSTRRIMDPARAGAAKRGNSRNERLRPRAKSASVENFARRALQHQGTARTPTPMSIARMALTLKSLFLMAQCDWELCWRTQDCVRLVIGVIVALKRLARLDASQRTKVLPHALSAGRATSNSRRVVPHARIAAKVTIVRDLRKMECCADLSMKLRVIHRIQFSQTSRAVLGEPLRRRMQVRAPQSLLSQTLAMERIPLP